MLLKYFYDPLLAQASYLVGCVETGEALIIDPAREILPYLQAARENNLRITHAAETHIHADFVSGLRELLAATDAKLYLSAMGGDDWQYEFADSSTVLLKDGDVWTVGNIRVEAIHTPGHTPEHLIYQITDTKNADQPMGLFTGDCLFVGNVGRPDLLEEVAGVAHSAELGAVAQFRNVQRLKTMPDYLQVWPGHGAGSACGKGLGAVPTSTLGYEKLFNPAFQFTDEAAFVQWLLTDQPEAPRYFAHMKILNKKGAPLVSEIPEPVHIHNRAALDKIVQMFLVFDTGTTEQFAARHIPGTVNVPANSDRFNTHVGLYVDYDLPTYLICENNDLPKVMMWLRAIGIDDIPGYFTPEVVADYDGMIRTTNPAQAATLVHTGKAQLFDVRSPEEYTESHIPNAQHLPMGSIFKQLDKLPRDKQIIIHCGSGLRSQVVTSMLQRIGFTNVRNLSGGIDAWQKAGLATESNT
ncbi:MAG: MBL fold metallo-hydrolase [Chloroflexi bacterium]|nr:MBL fold metallo-hydrolase [Chloroflexota bacterium]MCC6894451.1 MBL fold metallo-hydrolase [Anaerolineae bacterium]